MNWLELMCVATEFFNWLTLLQTSARAARTLSISVPIYLSMLGAIGKQ